jgi:hypothetical protein
MLNEACQVPQGDWSQQQGSTSLIWPRIEVQLRGEEIGRGIRESHYRELSASLHDSGRSGLVTSVVMLDRARRTDYDPQDAVGCTGRDATNLPAI